MDYCVHKTAAAQAELKIDIESAGHWFGGGVLLALQHHLCRLSYPGQGVMLPCHCLL